MVTIYRCKSKLNILKLILSHSAIPEVSVKYAATWVFSEVFPHKCRNITAKFNNSKEILEETLHPCVKQLMGQSSLRILRCLLRYVLLIIFLNVLFHPMNDYTFYSTVCDRMTAIY